MIKWWILAIFRLALDQNLTAVGPAFLLTQTVHHPPVKLVGFRPEPSDVVFRRLGNHWGTNGY